MYSTNVLNRQWKIIEGLPNYYITDVFGKNFNDIIVTGSFGLILYFNGLRWVNYQDRTYINGSYGRVGITGNIFAYTGGLNNGKA